MDDMKKKLDELEGKLAKYKPIYLEKKRMFRGVKHEDSLSELRYTEYMVYKEMVDSMEAEVRKIKQALKSQS